MLLEVHGWIPRLVERQFENLEGLVAQRMVAYRHHDWTAFTLARLRARIDAHVDALVLANNLADGMFAAAWGSGRPYADLAAGEVLLRSGDPERARQLWSALRAAPVGSQFGFVWALYRNRCDLLAAELADPPPELAAIASLAGRLPHAHDRRDPHPGAPHPGRSQPWRNDADPLVRAAAWRLAGLHPQPFPPREDFIQGIDDPSPDVREAAWWAGHAAGTPWLKAECAARLQRDVVAMRWFVVMTERDDAEHWHSALADDALGPERFIAAGGTGLLELGEQLVDAMETDPKDAVAANIGYRRLTGADFQSTERRPLGDPTDPFDLEKEAYIPDATAARKHLATLLTGTTPPPPTANPDTRTLWEQRARTEAPAPVVAVAD